MSRSVSEFSCFCCLPPLPTFFLLSVFYDPCFCRFFKYILMAKESSGTRSRAVKRSQPYKRSPSGRSRDTGEKRGESSRASAHHHSRS